MKHRVDTEIAFGSRARFLPAFCWRVLFPDKSLSPVSPSAEYIRER